MPTMLLCEGVGRVTIPLSPHYTNRTRAQGREVGRETVDDQMRGGGFLFSPAAAPEVRN